MREHRPEAAERRRRNRHAEARDVPLQERPLEGPAPLGRFVVVPREERARQAAAQPQPVEGGGADFVQSEAADLVEGDAAGQRLGRLLQQGGTGAAEDEEAGRRARPVGEDAQQGEDLRPPLDLVEDDESAQRPQVPSGLPEASDVGRILQIEEGRAAIAACDRARQGRLSDLTQAEDRDDRESSQQPAHRTDVFVASYVAAHGGPFRHLEYSAVTAEFSRCLRGSPIVVATPHPARRPAAAPRAASARNRAFARPRVLEERLDPCPAPRVESRLGA